MTTDDRMLPTDYAAWLARLKQQIAQVQQRAAVAVNRELILLYWQIGHDILQRQQRHQKLKNERTSESFDGNATRSDFNVYCHLLQTASLAGDALTAVRAKGFIRSLALRGVENNEA